ncbi:MAG TPA: hypothetical protein VKC53_02895 [Patescibacteria group bacterium]|nr:hypothetical protein [Patescibacteria group bacterium]
MTNLAQDTAKSAKNLAQQVAKQLAQEPLEILKNVREQATGEVLSGQDTPQPNQNNDQRKQIEQQGQLNDELKSGRRMEALNRELDDIRKQKQFSELQKRISEGEVISLEEYPELSMEQKQVLNAQMEAVKNQIAMQNARVDSSPLFGSSKPSRRFGQKQAAQKEQTRVEKPVPPSG